LKLFEKQGWYHKRKGTTMKKIFHLSVIIAAVSVLASAGILWAGPVATVCSAHSKNCFERDGDFYCTWTEDVRENKLVRGRAGLLTYVFVPTSSGENSKVRRGGARKS
jgi:hypothetical protein